MFSSFIIFKSDCIVIIDIHTAFLLLEVVEVFCLLVYFQIASFVNLPGKEGAVSIFRLYPLGIPYFIYIFYILRYILSACSGMYGKKRKFSIAEILFSPLKLYFL